MFRHREWNVAIQSEISQIDCHVVFTSSTPRNDVVIIGFKFVFLPVKIKEKGWKFKKRTIRFGVVFLDSLVCAPFVKELAA